MTDDRAPHNEGDDERVATPTEGLRILGAEPAAPARAVHWPDEGPSWTAADEPAEALVAEVADDGPDDDGPLDRRDDADATMAMPVLDPVAAEPGDGGSEAAEAVVVAADDTELPHWSEPPTGVVPAVFDQDGGSDEDGADWSAITGGAPRFRSGDGDWADDGFAEELVEAAAADPEMQGGALGTREADPNDSDEEFAAAVAQRRGGRRTVETPRRGPKPARPAVRPEVAATPGGRNLPAALATAGVLGLVAVLCFVAGEGLTALLAAAILSAAAAELVGTLRRKNLATAQLVVVAGAAAMPLAGWWRGPLGVGVVTGLVILTTLIWFLVEAGPGRPLIGSAMTLFAFAWVGGLGAFAGLLLEGPQGVEWLLAALIPTICADVFGYFCGRQFGKTPLAPRVSPNKTFEGFFFGVFLALVFTAAILTRFLAPFDGHGVWAVTIGIVAPLAAVLGDLCQSLLKRDLGIKDFSATLPGHGGILDRFDGLLFALPAVYFLMLAFL